MTMAQAPALASGRALDETPLVAGPDLSVAPAELKMQTPMPVNHTSEMVAHSHRQVFPANPISESSVPLQGLARDIPTPPAPEGMEPSMSAPSMSALAVSKSEGVSSAPLAVQGTAPVPEIARVARTLAWRLLAEHRSAMAFYLARSLERLYPDLLPQLPSWLLRALTLVANSSQVHTRKGKSPADCGGT